MNAPTSEFSIKLAALTIAYPLQILDTPTTTLTFDWRSPVEAALL
jgi:hypothetical protein